ncbi:MAG: hypothetical protein R3C03_05440 [Pirellulaceae bacterium]
MKQMNKARFGFFWKPSCVLLSMLFASGCYWAPRFDPPGTAAFQQSRAVLHDPFPNNDVAPPIVGGRPRDFDRPYPEAEQNQYDRIRNGGY